MGNKHGINEHDKEVGKALKELLQEKYGRGWSLAFLSDLAEKFTPNGKYMTQQALSAICSGRQSLSERRAREFSEVLKLPPSVLLLEKEDPAPGEDYARLEKSERARTVLAALDILVIRGYTVTIRGVDTKGVNCSIRADKKGLSFAKGGDREKLNTAGIFGHYFPIFEQNGITHNIVSVTIDRRPPSGTHFSIDPFTFELFAEDLASMIDQRITFLEKHLAPDFRWAQEDPELCKKLTAEHIDFISSHRS